MGSRKIDMLEVLNNKSVAELSQELLAQFENNKQGFFPFIKSIRFPQYKLLANNTKINFEYPVTVLVGENGCNKTSILQALYGSPAGKSLGEYWFETEVDKITKRSIIIYSYFQQKAGKDVEVLKLRIHVPGNPDYWEPSRPVQKYDMETVTKEELVKAGNTATTRWDPIEMNVVYCDCKEYVSAYDLFFYHYAFQSSKKFKHKHDYIRNQAKVLDNIITNDLENYKFYGKNVVQSNVHLSKESVNIISYIMEQEYDDIQIITHTLYNKRSNNTPSKTIFLRKKGMEYSEAFAGTGESRVTLLINDILNAPAHSLILLDEPEISLHPSAIKRLEKFLLSQALYKNQQIVVTTHSPYIIEKLPQKAIKFFKKNNSNRVIVTNETENEAAFELDSDVRGSVEIFVEDKLSKELVEHAINNNSEFVKEKINVNVLPGGANTIIKEFIKPESIFENNNRYFILDGDKKETRTLDEFNDLLDFDNHVFNESKLSEALKSKLYVLIEKLTGQKLKFLTSGNKKARDEKEKIVLEIRFLKYWMSHVFFLPCKTPELGIINESQKEVKKEDKNGKLFFKKLAEEKVGSSTSDDIFFTERELLHNLPEECELFSNIEKIINNILGKS